MNKEFMRFNNWEGKNGLKSYIIKTTNCKPFSGCGINIRKKEKTAILRSVDNTFYYNDDFTNVNYIKYTLFGKIGDQNINENKFNKPLLDHKEIKNIYVYRKLITNTEKNNYIWYGKYNIVKLEEKNHIDFNNNMRKIYVIYLEKTINYSEDEEKCEY